MNHRLIAGLTSAIMSMNMLTILPMQAFALDTEITVYEKEGYTVTYKVGSEWENNRSIEVTIENTGEESILNWALKYDVGGEVYNLWNSEVYESAEDYTIIKNNGYNYEIEAGQIADYGYIVTGEETLIPDDIELCSRRIEVKSGYEVDLAVTNDWYTGFNGEITVTNTSAEPIEAWTLLFDGNFTINNIWNAKLLSNEDGSYEIANQLWTTPIKPRESAVFGFTADKSATENATAENFCLTAVVIGESSLEAEPVEPENPEEIDYELDSDSDGLPDYYEDILGTDKNNTDTDGDSLSDGYEVLYLGTDPLKADSDDNGVNDGEEDFDKDGLTNAEESELGTNPNCADTDGDGLNDGAEKNTHRTDPLKFDSDDDGISDGDEIALGLDPNSSSTDGTPDSERTFAQTIDAESEVLSIINDDESVPFDVSLEIEAAGVAKNNVYARESGYSNAIENSAIVGVAPEFVYTDGLMVEKVTVKFELDDSVSDNTLGIYANDSDEFKGIKRLNVFMFFEDVNMLLPIESFHDEATNTVYTTTDRMGTYCLVDMEIFLDNLDKQLNVNEESEAEIEVQPEKSGAMSKNSNDADGYACCTVNKSDAKSKAEDDFDAVFMIDCRSVLSAGEYALIQKSIIEASDTIFIKSPNARVRIVIMNSIGGGSSYRVMKLSDIKSIEPSKDNSFFTNIDDVYSVLSKLPEMTEGGNDCNLTGVLSNVCEYAKAVRRKTFCFCYFKAKDTVYQVANVDSYDILHDIKDNSRDINISAICDNNAKGIKYGYAIDMCNMTKGFFTDGYDNSSDYVLSHIYADDGNVENGYKAIIATGYKTVVLNSSLQQNYEWYQQDANYDVYRDTDRDGLCDYQEIKFISKDGHSLINDDDPGNVKLLTFSELIYLTGDRYNYYNDGEKCFYVKDGLERYMNVTGEKGIYPDSLWNVPVLPIKSDPTSVDGDFDGLSDLIDSRPCNNIIAANLLHIDTGKNEEDRNEKDTEYDVEMCMDFTCFFEDNERFEHGIADMSVILSGLAYSKYGSYFAEDNMKTHDYYALKFENVSGTKDIKEVMGILGFSNIKECDLRENYADNHVAHFYLGHKKLEYNNQEKEIISVFVRGTTGVREWTSNFDIGESNDKRFASERLDYDNHLGFDVAAYRIHKEVKNYISSNNLDNCNISYWITGHSRGAAIANLIAAQLINERANVYAYTFATPNNVVKPEEFVESYKGIYNIVNEDDFVPAVPLEDNWGFLKYGKTYSVKMTLLNQVEWKINMGAFYTAPSSLSELLEAFKCLADNRDACYSGDTITESWFQYIPVNKAKSIEDAQTIFVNNLPVDCKEYVRIRNIGLTIDGRNWRIDYTTSPYILMNYFGKILGGESINYSEMMANILSLDKLTAFAILIKDLYALQLVNIKYPHYIDTYYILTRRM